MKITICCFLVFLFIFLSSCFWKHRYETGHFPESVTNFADVNSEFDDYNATEPHIWYQHLFHFSSNRNSKGEYFDIIGENMYIDWDKNTGKLEIGTDLFEDDRFDYLKPMFEAVNTNCNELGPYSIECRHNDSRLHLMMYSNDCDEKFDISFVYCEFKESGEEIKGPQKIKFLSSQSNDMYPSLFGKDFYYFDIWGVDVGKAEKIIYCSDKEGNYNIYGVPIPSDQSLIDFLESDLNPELVKLPINSDYDDKYPFVNGNLLVFSSNRPEGFGGFDLYYSRFRNGEWSEPKNFGEKINTEYDESRPISIYYENFDNDLLIFSSNRPGGKGGFDIYYVGIKQKIR